MIISFLRGRVEFVVAAFLLTNIAIAALMPLILPIVLGRPTPEAFVHVSGSVGLVMFIPMVVAWTLRALYRPAAEWPGRLRNVSFGIWVITMFLITSNASNFVRLNSDVPRLVLLEIAVASLLVCVASFTGVNGNPPAGVPGPGKMFDE